MIPTWGLHQIPTQSDFAQSRNSNFCRRQQWHQQTDNKNRHESQEAGKTIVAADKNIKLITYYYLVLFLSVFIVKKSIFRNAWFCHFLRAGQTFVNVKLQFVFPHKFALPNKTVFQEKTKTNRDIPFKMQIQIS